jgi:hypothetical protein
MRLAGLLAALGLAAPAHAQSDTFPTTEFREGDTSAAVSQGPLTAIVSLVRRPSLDPDFDTPVLSVTVDGILVLEVAGIASGFDFPTTEASIAEIDPGHAGPEVYFTSYGGGAHCCTLVIVATAVGQRWVAVPIGEFDGDGRYLTDLDGDGRAEIATYDNRFLYEFGCYACSAAPLIVLAVTDGEVHDVSADPRYLAAHRDWLGQLESGIDPAERWTSPGFLAGWVAAKIRVGEGEAAWNALNANWDFAADQGEEVCLTGEDIDDCPRRQRVVLSFPERLQLFLRQTGYMS